MFLKLFFLFMISFGVSESLYSKPDLSNPLIPLRSRQLCGYRNRPLRQKISHKNKCFIQSFEDEMAFNPLIEVYPNQSTPIARVVYGENALYGEAPWSVQIVLTREKGGFYFHCSGVLITDRHILTAAHCYSPPPDLYVFIGGYLPFSGYSTNKFQFIEHSNYTPEHINDDILFTKTYDIGIIVLDVPLDFAWYQYMESRSSSKYFQMNTICLPLTERSVPDIRYQNATFFGWGQMVNDDFPGWLQRGDIEVKYEKSDLFSFISWINQFPQGCHGDSGSGLVQYLDHQRTRAVLIGILSSGKTRNGTGPICDRSKATYFVRVVNVLDWIYDRLNETYFRNF